MHPRSLPVPNPCDATRRGPVANLARALRRVAVLLLAVLAGPASRATVLVGQPRTAEDERTVVRDWLACRASHPAARECASLRTRAMDALRQAVRDLAVSSEPADAARIVRLLRCPDPELRAAAADAVGARGLAAEQTATLLVLLNDPVPAVRRSAAGALDHAEDERARQLAARVRSSGAGPSFVPDDGPSSQDLPCPAYPGATYLFFTSAPDVGIRQFSTADPVETVVAFYAGRAKTAALTAEQFTGSVGGKPPEGRDMEDDPEVQALQKKADQLAKKLENASPAERGKVLAEIMSMQGAVMAQAQKMAQTVPLGENPYDDGEQYGPVRFVVFQKTGGGAMPAIASRFVAIFEDKALGKTVIALHVLPLPGN